MENSKNSVAKTGSDITTPRTPANHDSVYKFMRHILLTADVGRSILTENEHRKLFNGLMEYCSHVAANLAKSD